MCGTAKCILLPSMMQGRLCTLSRDPWTALLPDHVALMIAIWPLLDWGPGFGLCALRTMHLTVYSCLVHVLLMSALSVVEPLTV
jgi:hypothetical protein